MPANPMRWLLAAFAAVAVGSVSAAAAASLELSTAGLGASSVEVISCDPGGVTPTYTVQLGNVTEVVVSGVAPACQTGQMSLVLIDTSKTVIATGGPVEVLGSSVTLPIPVTPAASEVEGVHIVVEGL